MYQYQWHKVTPAYLEWLRREYNGNNISGCEQEYKIIVRGSFTFLKNIHLDFKIMNVHECNLKQGTLNCINQCRSGHNPMVAGFITTYATSAYHHQRCEFESWADDIYLIQH
jgi:hypothetical protein